ncbi:MAG: hypothetical protein AB2A00_12195 [Myxococcota bacterium]
MRNLPPLVLVLVTVACSGDPAVGAASSSSSASSSSTGGVSSSSASSGASSSSSGTASSATSSSSSGSSGTSSSSSGGACSGAALSQDTVDNLVISADAFGHFQMQPGQTLDLSVGTVACCYIYEPVDACVAWSISPTGSVTVDAATGVVEVPANTPSGSTFTVSADVEDGRRVISARLDVYRPEDALLVGFWTEVAQLECDGGAEAAPERAIQEVVFHADGTFGVTWTPFEIYVDYWGNFTASPSDGSLTMTVVGGNYVPPDVDGTGTFEIDEQGRLILHDIWLGQPSGTTQTPRCGHVQD